MAVFSTKRTSSKAGTSSFLLFLYIQHPAHMQVQRIPLRLMIKLSPCHGIILDVLRLLHWAHDTGQILEASSRLQLARYLVRWQRLRNSDLSNLTNYQDQSIQSSQGQLNEESLSYKRRTETDC